MAGFNREMEEPLKRVSVRVRMLLGTYDARRRILNLKQSTKTKINSQWLAQDGDDFVMIFDDFEAANGTHDFHMSLFSQVFCGLVQNMP